MKTNIKVIKIKDYILPFTLFALTLCIAIFSSQNLIASKNALKLWSTTVVPSLLPFFIATEVLSYTNVFKTLGKFLDKFMKPLFNVPGIGSGALILGIISGYPVGAKIVSDLRSKNEITKTEARKTSCIY